MGIVFHKDFVAWNAFKVGAVVYGYPPNVSMSGATNTTTRVVDVQKGERWFALPRYDNAGTFPKEISPWGDSPSTLQTFRGKDSPFVVLRIWFGHSDMDDNWASNNLEDAWMDFRSFQFHQVMDLQDADFVALELLGPDGRIYLNKQERDVSQNLIMWLPYCPSEESQYVFYEPDISYATTTSDFKIRLF